MPSEFVSIIIATVLISLISFLGIFFLTMKMNELQSRLVLLIALSAGVMLGGAFLHLLPEALQSLPVDLVMLLVVLSFILFLFVERVLHWHHCHKDGQGQHTLGYMNLFGDGVHNFIDGLIIAAGFMTSFELGVLTTLTVALHEIPQEISDLGVLLYSGFTRRQALTYNFLTATLAVLGGIVGYFLAIWSASLVAYLLPIASGGFIYIAAADLLPELREQTGSSQSTFSFVLFIVGILVMLGLRFVGAV